MQYIRKITEFSRSALRLLIGAIVAVLLTVMIMQIFFRYGLNSSLIWAEEVCRYLLLWLSFLAACFAYERGEIAAMTMLQDMLPRAGRLVMALICNALSLILLGTLIYYGTQYARLIGSEPIPALGFIFEDIFGSNAKAPSIFWVYIALPVGLGLLSLRLAADMVQYSLLLKTGGSIEATYRTYENAAHSEFGNDDKDKAATP